MNRTFSFYMQWVATLMLSYCLIGSSYVLGENKYSDWGLHILPASEEAGQLDYQKSITTFSLDILQRRIVESKSDNQLISPLGISFLLSMIKHAVGPEEQAEIERILHLPQENELNVSACNLMNRLMKNGLDIAGLLYVNPTYRLNSDYQSLASQYYHSKVESGSSAKQVNAWVQQVTNGQIRKIVDQGELQNFFLLLAHAIHFKADWAMPFKKEKTRLGRFLTPIKAIQTHMMHKMDKVDYYEDDNCQAIKLPYEGNTCAMLLILPKANNDFSFLNELYFANVLQGLTPEMVKITLPKFKLEEEVNVKEMLQGMGMHHLFHSPDFSSLIDMEHAASKAAVPNLAISQMKQKSVLACDEKGTEASVVTSVVIGVTSMPMLPKNDKEIIFNRPFVVTLLSPEVPILFGVIRDPSQKK